jgi:tRNA pseudouridine55 synthase
MHDTQHNSLMNYNEGAIILVNKPLDWTSFDVVKKIRNVTRAAKVGHAGTLDPLATGLLIVCTGKFTKQISIIQDAEKEYTGTIYLGAVTASGDRETEVEATFDITAVAEADIYNAVKQFTGTIMQVPPLHSAVKVNGQRAYKMARRGVDHKLDAKPVTIREFEITEIALPFIRFRVSCSKGTYIRSLAVDFGKALSSGAYLYELCRTRIGEYKLENAMDMKDVLSLAPVKAAE